MAKKKTFDSAYERLQEIQAEIQSDTISIENVDKLVKEAAELISYCKNRLRTIEDNLTKAFEEEES